MIDVLVTCSYPSYDGEYSVKENWKKDPRSKKTPEEDVLQNLSVYTEHP